MAWNYSPKEFIKVYRKFMEWEWYSDVNTTKLFIHCLLRANWKDGKWMGIHYEAGEFITSLPSLAKESGLTIQQVRTSLTKLISTGELTSKTTDSVTGRKLTKNRIITVNNWDKYQGCNSQPNSQNNSQNVTDLLQSYQNPQNATVKSTDKLTDNEMPENAGNSISFERGQKKSNRQPNRQPNRQATGQQQDSNSRYKKYRNIEDKKEKELPAAPSFLEDEGQGIDLWSDVEGEVIQ